MANFGGFLQALGQAFGGYAQDDQTRQQRTAFQQRMALDADQARRAADFQNAQVENWRADNDRQRLAGEGAARNRQMIADSWDAAINGDRQAQARIVSADPSLAPHFMPKPQTPHDPIMGSPEWLAAKEAEKQLDAKYRAPAEPKGPVPGTPAYYADLRKKLEIERDFRTPEGPKATDFSNKAALVYPKAAQASKVLDTFYTNGAPNQSVLGKVPLVGNFLLNDESQQMQQAAETVAAAILRLESGASISESEIKGAAKQFLPQPGDSPDVRAQKRATLQTQLEQMRNAAAPSMTSGAPRPTPAAAPPINDQPQSARLSPAQLQRAARDPEYKQFLQSTGKLR